MSETTRGNAPYAPDLRGSARRLPTPENELRAEVERLRAEVARWEERFDRWQEWRMYEAMRDAR